MIIKLKYFLLMQLGYHIKIRNSSFLLKLLTFFIILVIMNCSDIQSQQSKEYRIQVLDSLLISEFAYKYLNLTLDEVDKLEIIPIDIYRVNKNVKNYDNEENFSSFITNEYNRIDGFVYLNNKAVGYIQAFHDGDSWIMFGGVKKVHSGDLIERLTKLITRKELEQLYIVIGAAGIWLNRNGKTFVYNFYQDTPDFIPVSEYVNKILTKQGLLYALNVDGYFP